MYTYRQPYSNELLHYGILGMKWGVRRYQNYDGTYTDAGKAHYSKVKVNDEEGKSRFGAGHTAAKAVSAVSGVATTISTGVAYVELRAGLLDLPVIGISAASMATWATAEAIASKIEDKVLKEHEEPHEDPNYVFPEKKKSMTPEKDLALVNKGYGYKGTTDNCLFCTAAYELRRRGFDVVAEVSKTGNDCRKIEKYFKNAKIKNLVKADKNGMVANDVMYGDPRQKRVESLKQTIQSMPEGARGYLGVHWGQSINNSKMFTLGAHATTFEKVNGKAVVRETQSGRTYDFDEYFSPRTNYNNSIEINTVASPVRYMRWDNLDYDKTAISEAIFK